MRRLALLSVSGAVWFMFGAAASASADNGPHRQDRDGVIYPCATCHRGDTQPGVCYSCHGTTGTGATTDVQSGVGYADSTRGAGVGALRGGGFQYALMDSANPSGQSDDSAAPPVLSSVSGAVPVKAAGTPTTSSHTVDGAFGIAWGSDSASAGVPIQLRCASCHDPHGNGNYRVLRTLPNSSGASVPVAIADSANKVYTTANYWQVEDTNAPAYIANVSAWCSTCHTRYLSAEASAGLPTGVVGDQYRHTSDGMTQGGKSCIQCHVSHGSNAGMGTNSGSVGNPDGTAAPNDSKLLRINNRGTCQMCHQR